MHAIRARPVSSCVKGTRTSTFWLRFPFLTAIGGFRRSIVSMPSGACANADRLFRSS
jgi:hypothetical protein